MTAFVKPHKYSREWRRGLADQFSESVFVGDDFAYVFAEIDDTRGRKMKLACDAESGDLHLFELREALVRRARNCGWEAWINRFREVNVAGVLPEQEHGDLIIRPYLVVRVVGEGGDPREAFLVARPRHSILLTGSLATQPRSEQFHGEPVHRISGSGPASGTIIAVDPAGSVELENRYGEKSSWPASNYTVRARPSLIRARYGPQAWSSLQVATGVLTKNKRRNSYAVMDRFRGASDALTAIGPQLNLPGGGIAMIEREWSEVRVVEERQ